MKQCKTMILPFSTQLNGKPTYFVEKIHSGLAQNDLCTMRDFDLFTEDFDISVLAECNPKLHTIREDKNDRWTVGNKIHFFINCRQPDMFLFAPVLPVVRVQKVEIVWYNKKFINNEVEIYIDSSFYAIAYFKNEIISYIDNHVFSDENKLKELAQNDGFDTVEAFFEYFNEDFKGKIIHWTDLKY